MVFVEAVAVCTAIVTRRLLYRRRAKKPDPHALGQSESSRRGLRGRSVDAIDNILSGGEGLLFFV